MQIIYFFEVCFYLTSEAEIMKVLIGYSETIQLLMIIHVVRNFHTTCIALKCIWNVKENSIGTTNFL